MLPLRMNETTIKNKEALDVEAEAAAAIIATETEAVVEPVHMHPHEHAQAERGAGGTSQSSTHEPMHMHIPVLHDRPAGTAAWVFNASEVVHGHTFVEGAIEGDPRMCS